MEKVRISNLVPEAQEHIGHPSDLSDVHDASQLPGNVGQPLILNDPTAPAPTELPVQNIFMFHVS